MSSALYKPTTELNTLWAEYSVTPLLYESYSRAAAASLHITAADATKAQQWRMATAGSLPIHAVDRWIVYVLADGNTGDSPASRTLQCRIKVDGTTWSATQNIEDVGASGFSTNQLTFTDLATSGQGTLDIELTPQGGEMWLDALSVIMIFDEVGPPLPDPDPGIVAVAAYQDGPPLLLPSRRLVFN